MDKTITQEEIEKAAETYADRLAELRPTIFPDISEAFKDGANFALGKQEIKQEAEQEEIEKAAEKHADELRVISGIPGALVHILHDIAKSSYLQGAQDFLSKQEKDAEETSLCERQTDTSLKGRTMDKDEKFKPVEYEPIGCKNYPDIMDALGAKITRKYKWSYYDKRSETIKETLI